MLHTNRAPDTATVALTATEDRPTTRSRAVYHHTPKQCCPNTHHLAEMLEAGLKFHTDSPNLQKLYADGLCRHHGFIPVPGTPASGETWAYVGRDSESGHRVRLEIGPLPTFRVSLVHLL